MSWPVLDVFAALVVVLFYFFVFVEYYYQYAFVKSSVHVFIELKLDIVDLLF